MKTKLFYLILLSTITLFSQTQIGNDIDGEAASNFLGSSVSLSSDGNTLAIGAPENSSVNGSYSGHVRVYQNMSNVWTQIGADIDGEAASDYSGWSVSLSADGSILAIGAVGNDGNGSDSGHVRVYQNLSGVWMQIGTDIEGEGSGDYSGWSVSLSSDGSTVAIGATRNTGGSTGAGHVRVYQNISNVWTQMGDDIDGEAINDESGTSVNLSSSGNIVAIGARYNGGNGSYSGHVRVYQYLSNIWTQMGGDIDGETAYADAGRNISLSSDGNTLAITAIDNGSTSSYVRVYEYNTVNWIQIGTDIVNGLAAYDNGLSVSLSSDGSILAIGNSEDYVNNYSGYVRIYQNSSGGWSQIGTDIYGEAAFDKSGYSISLSSDGSILAIGAPENSGVNGSYSGHVRVYELSALLSLVDNEISKSFTVYPNPVNNQLYLQLSPSLEFKKATIYNYYGQLVLQSKTIIINVSNLSSGVYFLEVETNKGKGVKKIIKK